MARKETKLETLPFDSHQFRQMTESEFSLMVVGYEKREQMDREIAQRGKVAKKIRDTFKITDGFLGEVITRKPHHCEYYDLGKLSKILLADGTSLGRQIKEVFQLYLFRIESIQIQDSRAPILTGYAQPYDLHCNRVGAQLEQKVTVYMAQTPTLKTKTAFMCL